MDIFLRIDVNIIAMILLTIIFFLAWKQLDKQDLINKVFLRVSPIIIIELLLETITCIINKRTELWLIPISYFMHICLFTVAPILTYYWYLLTKNMISTNKNSSIKTNTIFILPIIINTIITFLSPIYHFVFYINNSNIYQRGYLYPISMIITYFYILHGLIFILMNRRKMMKQEFVPLHLFSGLPLLGGIIQAVFYGPLLMWSCAAFSLVFVYIFLQQRKIHLDDLTGAWDRQSFYTYITHRITIKHNDNFGIIFVDVDRLKQINDGYGHNEGDFAIKTSIQIIKSIIKKEDIIVRLGGDEFAIIINCESKEALDNMIFEMHAAFFRYNSKSEKGYELECSLGADMFNSKYTSIDHFLNHVDNLMYINKRKKKEKLAYN